MTQFPSIPSLQSLGHTTDGFIRPRLANLTSLDDNKPASKTLVAPPTRRKSAWHQSSAISPLVSGILDRLPPQSEPRRVSHESRHLKMLMEIGHSNRHRSFKDPSSSLSNRKPDLCPKHRVSRPKHRVSRPKHRVSHLESHRRANFPLIWLQSRHSVLAGHSAGMFHPPF